MQHSSGVIYEGLWINGKPATMAVRLQLRGVEGPLEVVQGTAFDLEVVCVNEAGEVIPGKLPAYVKGMQSHFYASMDMNKLFFAEEGRVLQLTAGYKLIPPAAGKPKTDSQPSLFDVIEDMEEKPISTPL